MLVWLCVATYVLATVNGCDDVLHAFVINEPQGQVTYDTCAQLVAAWPYLCNPSAKNSLAQTCCASCPGVDYSCADTMISMKLGSDVLMCKDLATPQYNGYCADTRVQAACCSTCSLIDTSCIDNPATRWTGGQGCMEMAENYGCLFCAKFSSYCCKSCEPLTEEICENGGGDVCRDDPTWKLILPDKNGVLKCPDLAKPEYQCQCKMYRRWCCESCEDVDDDVCRDCSVWSQEVRGTKYSDCSLMEKFPYLCNVAGFYDPEANTGLCCKTCASLGDLSCTDNPFPSFSIGNAKLYCDQLIERNKCFCDNKQVRRLCCSSCQVDHSECGCKDILTSDDTVTVLGKKFSSCRSLLNEKKGFPYYCKEERFSEFGGFCCKSCERTNTTCVDEPIMAAPYYGAGKRPCRELISEWPFFCKHTSEESEDGYKDKCCASCASVNASCTDAPVFIKPTPHGTLLNCKQLAKQWPYYCTPGVLDDKCCHSCRNANMECTENPGWQTTITNRKGAVLCNNCSCQDLKQKKYRKILKKVCCEDVAGAKTECCVQCRRIKC